MAPYLLLWSLPLVLLFASPSSWFAGWPILRQFASFPLVIYSFVRSDTIAFDPREATIVSTHYALYNGLTSCRHIVSAYISRIEALNQHTNAIISLNPHALDVADSMDRQLRSGQGPFGPLFCIPTLLKDNFDTKDMPTTDGNLALAESQPSLDAASVVALKKTGSIILGKTNLHELALEGLTVSSLGGQTINPYDSQRTPGGSSGGTGAAVAASFSVWGTGSDTVNSLRSPASANSLFTCRPTRGLISRAGIIPVSYVQDSIGPIARTVEDVAIALTVMASSGYDARDNITALAPPHIRAIDYATSISTGSLRGLRLGIVEGFFNRTDSDETTPVNEVMAYVMAQLEHAGVVLVPITEEIYDSEAILKMDVQRFTYRESMDAYLQQPSLGGRQPSTFQELLDTKKFLAVPKVYEYITTAMKSSSSNETYSSALAKIHDLTLAVHKTFAEHKVDALIYPEQRNLVVTLGAHSQIGRNGILAALTGLPVVVIPAGFSKPTTSAPIGVPIGMEILGLPFSEENLLKIAYQIDRLAPKRRSPPWAEEIVPVKNYSVVPDIKPELALPKGYIRGVLS